MAKIAITVRIPAVMVAELADYLWQSGRPTDPPVPPSTEPTVLTDEQCVQRWVKRELKTRYRQFVIDDSVLVPKKLMSAETASSLSAAVASPPEEGID